MQSHILLNCTGPDRTFLFCFDFILLFHTNEPAQPKLTQRGNGVMSALPLH